MGEPVAEAFEREVVRPALGTESAPASTWKRWTNNVANFFTGRPSLTAAGVAAVGTAAAAHALGAGEAIPADSIIQNLGNAGIVAGAGLAGGALAGLATKGIMSVTSAEKIIQDVDTAVRDAANIAAAETTADAEAARSAENSSGRNLKVVPAVAAAGTAAVSAADEVRLAVEFLREQREIFAATRSSEDALLLEDAALAVIEAFEASKLATNLAATQTQIAAERVLAGELDDYELSKYEQQQQQQQRLTEEEEDGYYDGGEYPMGAQLTPSGKHYYGQRIVKKSPRTPSPRKSPRRSYPKSAPPKSSRSVTVRDQRSRSRTPSPRKTQSISSLARELGGRTPRTPSSRKTQSISSLARELGSRTPRTPRTSRTSRTPRTPRAAAA